MPPLLLPLPQVYGYALFKNEGKAVVKYPMDGQAVDVAGRSFHHGAGKEGKVWAYEQPYGARWGGQGGPGGNNM